MQARMNINELGTFSKRPLASPIKQEMSVEPVVQSSLNVFDYLDYKEFTRKKIEFAPKTRGEHRRIASAMRVHTSMITQVLRGNLHFTLDQGLLLAELFGLIDNEIEYFLLLIQYARAGSTKLQGLLHEKIIQLKNQQGEISKNVSSVSVMDLDWFSLIVLAAVENETESSIEGIVQKTKTDAHFVRVALEKLKNFGICSETNGRWKLNSTSPLKNKEFRAQIQSQLHLLSLQKLPFLKAEDVSIGQITQMSQSDFNRVAQLTEEIKKITERASSESKTNSLKSFSVCTLVEAFKI